MKKSILLSSLMSLCATAFAEFTSDIVVSNAGGNWSDASTWTTPENAVPENSSESSIFSNLTLGEGKLVLDANASNQYVENIVFSGSSASIEIAAGKTFSLVTNKPYTSTFVEKNKSLIVSGEGNFVLNASIAQTGLQSTLVLDANTTFKPAVVLQAGANLTVNKSLSTSNVVINNNAVNITISEGAVYTAAGRINAFGGGTVNIYGEMTLGSDFTMQGTKTTVYGVLKANQNNNGNVSNIGNVISGNPMGGTFVVKNGGKAYFGNRIYASNPGRFVDLFSGSITVEKGALLDVLNGIKMHSGTTMNFGGGTTNIDAIVMANYNKSGAMTTTSTMTMNVSGATTLAKVVMDDGSFANANDTQLTINFKDLANGEALTINELTGLTANRFIVLENFSEGDFYVKNALATNADGSIIGMAFGGESLFQLEDGKIVIPEPSTYAIIFGALALGFVAYRRRK